MNRPHFIHINRTGGTSIRTYLGTTPPRPGVPHHSHETVEEYEARRGDALADVDLFTVVRNPYARLISQYLHRWRTNYLGLRSRRITFEQFLWSTYLERAGPDYDLARYFWPMASFLRSGQTPPTPVRVFYYEDGFDAVERWLAERGVGDYGRTRIGVYNASGYQGRRPQISANMVRHLKGYFSDDWLRFDYDPDYLTPYFDVRP